MPHTLNAAALQRVARYFQALADPTRLQIVNHLRTGPQNVSQLAAMCGCSLANTSRHLGLLAQNGLVERQSQGTCVYYHLADPAISTLCDLVCEKVLRGLENELVRAQSLRDNSAADG